MQQIQNAIELDVRYIVMRAIREGLEAGYDSFIDYGSDDNEDMWGFQEKAILDALSKVLKLSELEESTGE
jgi:hypothetical protein